MADTTTTRYSIVKPEVGASADSWGSKQNSNRDKYDALLGAMALAGGTTVYTLSTGLSLAAYVNGQSFLVRVNATNTGASTLNVDSIGAKNLRKNVGGTLTALAANDLYIGDYVRLTYNSASDVIVVMGMSPSAKQNAIEALTWADDRMLDLTGANTIAVVTYATVLSNIDAVGLTGNQTIAGSKTFTGSTMLASAAPLLYLDETDGAADQRLTRFRKTGGNVLLETRTDADGSGANILTITAGAGTAIASFGITPPLNVKALDTSGVLVSGTYTPTLTNTSNIDSSTARVTQYMRVGNVVTVAGTVLVDPTAAANTVMGMSLPIPSNFAQTYQLGGTAFAGNGSFAASADVSNDRVTWVGATSNGTAQEWSFQFSYLVI